MSDCVHIKIDGRDMEVAAGQTVMQAAEGVGIKIPGLCNHPELRAEGACRLCLVEIEKQRVLQPACTFPVVEGMVVRTQSEPIRAARIFALQMLFSERSHQCMICPKSGPSGKTDCELQQLAYDHGMDHWEFAPGAGRWPIDATRWHFIMDHSRCILCRRCVRACNVLAANHTLGVHERGARTMIGADDDLPFGESSCISCGTCLQVCPTGALADRFGAFAGRASECVEQPGVCVGCAVGCRTRVFTRDNGIVRIEGDWGGPNGGMLCGTGRFEMASPRQGRITWPMVRRGETLVETSWNQALEVVGQRFAAAERVGGLVSPRLPNESLAAIACFFDEVLRSNELGLLYGDAPPPGLGRRGTLRDLPGADCIIVIAADPLEKQNVAGMLIRRALDIGAKLIVVSDAASKLDPFAQQHLQLHDITAHEASPFARLRNIYHLSGSGIATLRSAAAAAQRPVVCYGPGLSLTVYNALRSLPEKTKFLPLVHGSNAIGAARIGLKERQVWGEALYAHLGDDASAGDIVVPEREFLVVQAARQSPWTEAADVVLPALTWNELSGHVINMAGDALELTALTQPPRGVHNDTDMLMRLAAQMGRGSAFVELSAMTTHMMG